MSAEETFIDAVSGADVRQLLVQRYWYCDELSNPVNVLFAERKDGVWVRFYFDAGVFFCSLEKTPELPESADGHRYDLEDLCISGTIAAAEVTSSIERLEVVQLLFCKLAEGDFIELS